MKVGISYDDYPEEEEIDDVFKQQLDDNTITLYELSVSTYGMQNVLVGSTHDYHTEKVARHRLVMALNHADHRYSILGDTSRHASKGELSAWQTYQNALIDAMDVCEDNINLVQRDFKNRKELMQYVKNQIEPTITKYTEVKPLDLVPLDSYVVYSRDDYAEILNDMEQDLNDIDNL